MEKGQKTIGLCRELIIHPGETLQEIIEDRDMTQKELAIRTGMTEKHVSTIINGKKPISVNFAKKLEYALGIEAAFWINLQANYDRELLEFEEMNNICEEELNILKNLKEVISDWSRRGWMNEDDNPAVQILDLRKIMGMSNLTAIPNLVYNAAFRAQAKNHTIDVYVLFAWQRMCELLTQNIGVIDELNIEKLKRSIPEIKKVMFLNSNQIQERLTDIFAECGIAFKIVKHFKGAPVQGFIKRTEKGKMVLCMTLRNSFADIFWFTLFHEIAHIIYGDSKNKFVDFDSVSSDVEYRADRYASNVLIPANEYEQFVRDENFSLNAIRNFADKFDIQPFIVLGRLMKDEVIDWNAYSKERLRYKWA